MDFESRSNVVDVYVRYLREKIDRPFGRELDRDRARRRLPPAGDGMSRLPIRLRLTLAFARRDDRRARRDGSVRLRARRRTLLASVDQALRSQSAEALAHAQRGEPGSLDRDVAGGTTLAQLVDARGRVIDSSPAGAAPLLSASDAAHVAGGGRSLRSTTLSSPPATGGVLAARVPAAATSSSSAARSSRDESRSTGSCASSLLAGPLALLLASLAGYGLAAAALRPVEAMRRRAAAISRRDARPPAGPAEP